MPIYDTDTLLGVVRELDPFDPFLLNMFFPEVITFEGSKIDFDVIAEDMTLAPFVSPLVAGKAQKSQGGELRSFAPAYIKPKDVVDPERVLRRRPGEAIGGSLSPAQRRDAIIADILLGQRNKILRRLEWMAAQALLTGTVTVEGADYPSQVVDFRRDAGNTLTLPAADKWTAGTAEPLVQIEEWNDLAEAPITDLIMDSASYSNLIKFNEVQQLLDVRRGADNVTLALAPGNEKWVQFKGLLGAYRVWVYKGFYKDAAGTKQAYVPVNTVIAASAAVEGVRAFGAILDGAAGYRAMDQFPKNWMQEDPAVEYVMTQSAPLMVPARPNASLAVKTA